MRKNIHHFSSENIKLFEENSKKYRSIFEFRYLQVHLDILHRCDFSLAKKNDTRFFGDKYNWNFLHQKISVIIQEHNWQLTCIKENITVTSYSFLKLKWRPSNLVTYFEFYSISVVLHLLSFWNYSYVRN